MRFEEFAARAGRTAADVGRRAERPALAGLLHSHRRRTLVAGWSTVTVVASVVLGVVLLWPTSRSEPSPAANITTTTAQAEGTASAVTESGRESCSVTEPGDSPFTPASETPDGPPRHYESVWYGTPDLWTMVLDQGQVWVDLPVGTDGGLTQKTFWWSEDYVPSSDRLPDITVTAEHVNEPTPGVIAGGPATSGAHVDLGSFMLVDIEVPKEGCWMITAEYRDTTLGYVVWVANSN